MTHRKRFPVKYGPVQRQRETGNAGWIKCLKCDRKFKSPDKIYVRLCPSCHASNSNVRADLEGW